MLKRCKRLKWIKFDLSLTFVNEIGIISIVSELKKQKKLECLTLNLKATDIGNAKTLKFVLQGLLTLNKKLSFKTDYRKLRDLARVIKPKKK